MFKGSTPRWDIRKELAELSIDLDLFVQGKEELKKLEITHSQKNIKRISDRIDEKFWQHANLSKTPKEAFVNLVKEQCNSYARCLPDILVKHYPSPVREVLGELNEIHKKRSYMSNLRERVEALQKKIANTKKKLEDILYKSNKLNWYPAIKYAWTPIDLTVVISAMNEEFDGTGVSGENSAPSEEVDDAGAAGNTTSAS